MRKWFLLTVASVAAFGCGSSQVKDFIQNNPGVNPTGLVISPKPVSKLIGQTQQFVATASFDNGTTQDVTTLVTWSSSNPAVVTIGATTGLATAVLPGQVTITAQSGSFGDSATMTVTGGIALASQSSAGVIGDAKSEQPATSADGRFVAFRSRATNLVAGDSNGRDDIFVRDRQTGTTTRVSVDSAGVQANSDSFAPSISADGRFVAFGSNATNLVIGDSNALTDVFVHDRQTATTTRVSVDSASAQANASSGSASVSGDGRFVAFDSDASNLVTGDTNGTQDCFVRDRQTGTTTRVSVDSAAGQGNGGSGYPSISADGRLVAFRSGASNLVAGGMGADDVFVHDRQTGTTTRVSVDSAGSAGNGTSDRPWISADGRFVAFASFANNLVTDDSNGFQDIFVHDRQTAATTRVNLDSAGVQANNGSRKPSISSDGRFVAFGSDATNLVTGDSNGFQDVFVRDRQTGTTTRVSLNAAGVQGDSFSYEPWISADGLFVAFTSLASNLVTGDTNAREDVFVTNRQ